MSTNFIFGEYASIGSTLEYLLTSCHSVATTSEHLCPNSHAVDPRRREKLSSEFFVFADRGTLVQGYFDDFTTPLSEACPSCSSNLARKFRFVMHPPLLAISFGENEPYIENVLSIKCDDAARSYYQFMIYFDADHFTARVID